MFSRLSAPALHALRRMLDPSSPEQASRASLSSAVMAPTMVLVNDPIEDVEKIVVDVLREPGRRAAEPNRWMQEYVGSRGGDLNDAELPILNGRRCCYDLSRKLERQLHHMRLPARRTCSCGATWSIEMAVRPDQRSNRHGR